MNLCESGHLKLALPKGRMQQRVFDLLGDAGISVGFSKRGYRPNLSLPNIESKILKPQNVVDMLLLGSRDLGFAGADWIEELGSGRRDNIVEVIDTEMDPVRLVVAAPRELLVDGRLPDRKLVVASEYENLTKRWFADQGISIQFVRSNGATEVFPPEDADLIVDNTATGATLRENGLVIVDEIMRSSTRLYASQQAYSVPEKRQRIDDLKLLIQSVLEGRRRSMIEVNVGADDLTNVIDVLPAMQQPTVSPLFGGSGFAVRAAVLRTDLPHLIPNVKSAGGRDVVVVELNQIVP